MITKKYTFSKDTLETLRMLNRIITDKNIELNALNLLTQGLVQAEYQGLSITPQRQGFKRKITPNIDKNEILVEDTPEIIVPGQN